MGNKKKRKPMSYRKKYILYSILSYTLLFLPLLIVIGINFKTYFFHYEGYKVSLGCILTLVMIILMIKGKASVLKGGWGFLIVFILSYLFKPIINDLVLLSGSALLGKLMSNTVDFKVVRYKRLSEAKETSDINATAMKDVLRELKEENSTPTYIGRV